jgi:hypothetical protein
LVVSVIVTATRHATAMLSATAMLRTASAPLPATTLCTDLRMAARPAATLNPDIAAASALKPAVPLNPDIATTSAASKFATAMTSAVEFAPTALSTTPTVPALAATPA